MKPRTLKEVAQAGLVLGFEWIARDSDDDIYLYAKDPYMRSEKNWSCANAAFSLVYVQITDYPNLPPEKSLIKLSEIVEGKV